ncbi:hypothetical protein HII13_002486 [Brettanomyces bruxellensis]|nr:hypothetical protein HII13_002486 [Brettanomyces bruxellensis]
MSDASSKIEANYGGKVFLPQSALNKLTMLNISGVLEFTAEEGRCYMPQWMLDTLQCQPGTLVKIQTTDLPLGSFVKLEPQSVDFLEITDPKAVLENALRNFATLTVGDIIQLHYNNQIYKIKILEAKPDSESQGICVIETDLETDFAPPVGYALDAPALRGEGSMAKQIHYDKLLRASEDNDIKFKGTGIKLSGKKVTKTSENKDADKSIDKLDLSGSCKPLNLPDGYLFFGFPVVPYKDDVEEAEEKRKEKVDVSFKGEGHTLRHSKKRKDKRKSHLPKKNKEHSPETIVID